ncbi:MAG: adenine phosphoribosyltransferase [Pseudomonadota bacterium]
MDRDAFHKTFKAPGPVVLPVIHVIDSERTLANIAHVVEQGAAGCFLINHDFGVDAFLPIVRDVRRAMTGLWLGVNFLGVTGERAFPLLGELEADGCPIDAYWADDARIEEIEDDQWEADTIGETRTKSGWSGMYFGGTAFKKQRPVAPENYEAAARNAVPFMDVITTSGVATGQEADLTKIRDFRRGIGDAPLALASGVTPDNARTYSDVDAFLVATGINHPGNFYDIDPERLAALMAVTRRLGQGRKDG